MGLLSQSQFFQTIKKASQSFLRKQKINQNHFWPRHVRGQKYISDCKCGICPLAADKLCAQQAAEICRKAPAGLFDSL